MDKIGSNYLASINSLVDRLSIKLLLLQIPIGKESSFNGVIDIVSRRVMYWDLDGRGLTYRATDIPNEYKDVVEGCCGLLIDSIVEFDNRGW